MKIAFVVARYGEYINGGAEVHCREIAKRCAEKHTVSILTTCAHNYQTWRNHYLPGEKFIDKCQVIRFPVDFERPKFFFDQAYNFLNQLYLLQDYGLDVPINSQQSLNFLMGKEDFEEGFVRFKKPFKEHANYLAATEVVEDIWMKLQGPHSSALERYILDQKENYDCFIFISYNYATTYMNLIHVKEKAILIPTLHEEACSIYHSYHKLFSWPKWILFNTEEEREFANRIYKDSICQNQEVVGLGIDEQDNTFCEDIAKQKYNIDGPYILYVGRLVEAKGVIELFNDFLFFKKANPDSQIKLILVGEICLDIPESHDIFALGYVSDIEKDGLLKYAKLFVMPSYFESFSIAIMEAWIHKLPVLVNEKCNVLSGHCERSGGGLVYSGPDAFCQKMNYVLSDQSICSDLGKKGYQYVKENFIWNQVMAKIEATFRKVVNQE